MKKVIYLSIIALIVIITFISCEKETETDVNISPVENLKLTSPKGLILASNKEELKDFIILNSNSKVLHSEIEIDNVKYFENDIASFGVVDYFIDSQFKSILIALSLKDGYYLLKDKHSVIVVKKSVSNTEKGSILNFPTNQDQRMMVDNSAKCQGDNCCSWERTGPNRFNCGCENPAVIITTSDGCEVEL